MFKRADTKRSDTPDLLEAFTLQVLLSVMDGICGVVTVNVLPYCIFPSVLSADVFIAGNVENGGSPS